MVGEAGRCRSPKRCGGVFAAHSPPPPAVSNAGRGLVGPLELQSVEAARRLLDTNVLGLLRLVRQVLPDMKRRRSGHVVVMSSVLGLQGGGGRGTGAHRGHRMGRGACSGSWRGRGGLWD